MKDPNYNIMIMSTFSGLTVPDGNNQETIMVNEDLVIFKYP